MLNVETLMPKGSGHFCVMKETFDGQNSAIVGCWSSNMHEYMSTTNLGRQCYRARTKYQVLFQVPPPHSFLGEMEEGVRVSYFRYGGSLNGARSVSLLGWDGMKQLRDCFCNKAFENSRQIDAYWLPISCE